MREREECNWTERERRKGAAVVIRGDGMTKEELIGEWEGVGVRR